MEQKQTTHFLSLIVPVFKQEKTIVKNITQLQEVLNTIRYDYEIIVVIDGMLDRSYMMLKKTRIPKIKCYAYKDNHGKSYAIRLGMNEAKGDYVMFIDSGMEIDPNGISMLLEHMEWYNADMIVGSKRHPVSQVQYPFSRKILSYGYYYLVRILFGVSIRDTQAGIKIFKKKLLQKILPVLVEKKFSGDLEMIVVSYEFGFKRIFEAPIKLNYHIGNISSAATIRSIWYIFLDTMAIFYRKNILGHYKKSKPLKLHYPKGVKTFNTLQAL